MVRPVDRQTPPPDRPADLPDSRRDDGDALDETVDASFPASDPPSTNPTPGEGGHDDQRRTRARGAGGGKSTRPPR